MPIVSSKVLATKLGVTQGRISQLVHEGMPRESWGKYDLEKCEDWLTASREDSGRLSPEAKRSLLEERTRYYAAQADGAEWRLQKDKDIHVEQEVALAVFAAVCAEVIQSLDTWVDEAPDAEEQDRRRDCAWLCRDRIDRALEDACADTASMAEHQAAGLQNRRQLR